MTTHTKVGLFIGRFQPLHKGHVLMLKKCARKVERLVIGLGSSNAQPSCKNPFTVSERREMIVKGMQELGIRNYEIVELPDCESDEEWVKEVNKAVGKFDLAWSGSKWVVSAFKTHDLPVEGIKEFSGLSATKIRRNMAKGLPWLKYVPLSVRKYLAEINAAKRVKALCKLR